MGPIAEAVTKATLAHMDEHWAVYIEQGPLHDAAVHNRIAAGESSNPRAELRDWCHIEWDGRQSLRHPQRRHNARRDAIIHEM